MRQVELLLGLGLIFQAIAVFVLAKKVSYLEYILTDISRIDVEKELKQLTNELTKSIGKEQK
jgi:hypothetical protein